MVDPDRGRLRRGIVWKDASADAAMARWMSFTRTGSRPESAALSVSQTRGFGGLTGFAASAVSGRAVASNAAANIRKLILATTCNIRASLMDVRKPIVLCGRGCLSDQKKRRYAASTSVKKAMIAHPVIQTRQASRKGTQISTTNVPKEI